MNQDFTSTSQKEGFHRTKHHQLQIIITYIGCFVQQRETHVVQRSPLLGAQLVFSQLSSDSVCKFLLKMHNITMCADSLPIWMAAVRAIYVKHQ